MYSHRSKMVQDTIQRSVSRAPLDLPRSKFLLPWSEKSLFSESLIQPFPALGEEESIPLEGFDCTSGEGAEDLPKILDDGRIGAEVNRSQKLNEQVTTWDRSTFGGHPPIDSSLDQWFSPS